MNIPSLQRGQHLAKEGDGLAAEQISGLPFASPTQQTRQLPHPQIPQGVGHSPLPGMSLISQLASPPAAGSHSAALQRIHLQNVAGGQSIIGGHPKMAMRALGGRAMHAQDYYYRKWRRLKKLIKDTVFINASVCDEVIRVEEKLAKSKEERRFLLRKLLQYQSLTEPATPVVKTEASTPPQKSTKSPSVVSTPSEAAGTEGSAVKAKTLKKKAAASSGEKKKTAASKELIDSMQPKPKKAKSGGGNRRMAIPPIPLDPTGRPVFPLVLGDLTVHSLGELVPDRNCFHSPEAIYPVGFCCTRVFASMSNPEQKCLYTCKISDSGPGPVFEIGPEENADKVFQGKTPSECHSMLLKAVGRSRNSELNPTPSSGADFFGLTHPIVRNLIQSLPGARKCSGYKWHKFEVNKGESIDNVVHCPNDPVVNHEALKKILGPSAGPKPQVISAAAQLEPSTSLRSLLTSGPFSTSAFSQK